jgi:hypothetical protein
MGKAILNINTIISLAFTIDSELVHVFVIIVALVTGLTVLIVTTLNNKFGMFMTQMNRNWTKMSSDSLYLFFRTGNLFGYVIETILSTVTNTFIHVDICVNKRIENDKNRQEKSETKLKSLPMAWLK